MEDRARHMRIGTGYDIHRFASDGRLILGGVQIPFSVGLAGHSDADCLSHAIADAILGAAGLADIGHFFPNDDPSIKGINSQQIIKHARIEIERLGFHIVNVDSTIIAEHPRIGPYLEAIKSCLAETLQIPTGAIGVKATTNESIGALGRAEGIAAHAVCLLSGSRDTLPTPK